MELTRVYYLAEYFVDGVHLGKIMSVKKDLYRYNATISKDQYG
jgi:hypothetical protein